MAKAPAKGKGGKPAAKGKGKGGKGGKAAPATGGPLLSPTNKIIITLAGLALVPFAIPTLLFLFVCMLPTLGAVFAERGSGRQAWVSVGGLNFAGCAHWLLNLWFAHHTMGYAIEQLRTITPLLVAYSASALGWALYLAMPPLVNAVTSVTSQRRVVTLAAQQRKLIDQWGDGVISRDAKVADKLGDKAGDAAGSAAPARV